MSRATEFLKQYESGYHYSKLDNLYTQRAQFKVEGKRPARDHKNYKEYRNLTKQIRKVRTAFAKKLLKHL